MHKNLNITERRRGIGKNNKKTEKQKSLQNRPHPKRTSKICRLWVGKTSKNSL